MSLSFQHGEKIDRIKAMPKYMKDSDLIYELSSQAWTHLCDAEELALEHLRELQAIYTKELGIHNYDEETAKFTAKLQAVSKAINELSEVCCEAEQEAASRLRQAESSHKRPTYDGSDEEVESNPTPVNPYEHVPPRIPSQIFGHLTKEGQFINPYQHSHSTYAQVSTTNEKGETVTSVNKDGKIRTFYGKR